jgi:hypothetical protein
MYLYKICHWTILWGNGVPCEYSFCSNSFNDHFTWWYKCLYRQLQSQSVKTHSLQKCQISCLLWYGEDLYRKLSPHSIVVLLLWYQKSTHYLEHHFSSVGSGTLLWDHSKDYKCWYILLNILLSLCSLTLHYCLTPHSTDHWCPKPVTSLFFWPSCPQCDKWYYDFEHNWYQVTCLTFKEYRCKISYEDLLCVVFTLFTSAPQYTAFYTEIFVIYCTRVTDQIVQHFIKFLTWLTGFSSLENWKFHKEVSGTSGSDRICSKSWYSCASNQKGALEYGCQPYAYQVRQNVQPYTDTNIYLLR